MKDKTVSNAIQAFHFIRKLIRSDREAYCNGKVYTEQTPVNTSVCKIKIDNRNVCQVCFKRFTPHPLHPKQKLCTNAKCKKKYMKLWQENNYIKKKSLIPVLATLEI